MFIFLKLAWGNITKDLRSSATILTAVFISVFFMEFTMGYVDGFRDKLVKEALNNTGHIKAYNKGFYGKLDFAPINHNIVLTKELIDKIKSVPGVTSVRPEINYGVMASAPDVSSEAKLQAIDYKDTSGLYDRLKKGVSAGKFPENDNEMIIGYKLAQLLKTKAGDKLILLSVDQYGGMNAVEGKIAGIFTMHNPNEDEDLVVCSLAMAQKLLALDGSVTELFINIKDPFKAQGAAKELASATPGDMIFVPWQKGSSMLYWSLETFDFATFMLAGIIIFVAGLGIINSFLMNIMGRLPDFGVLRAMGTGKNQILMMIITESFLLGILGTIIGLIPGIGLVYYFQVNPINYESLGDMMGAYGPMSALIGTSLKMPSLIAVIITGLLVSIIGSLYPATVAANSRPVDIMRVLE